MNQRSAILRQQQASLTRQTQEAVPQLMTLTVQQYKAFEASLPVPDPRVTEPVQAGIQLGIQIALSKLREGFTVGL